MDNDKDLPPVPSSAARFLMLVGYRKMIVLVGAVAIAGLMKHFGFPADDVTAVVRWALIGFFGANAAEHVSSAIAARSAGGDETVVGMAMQARRARMLVRQ